MTPKEKADELFSRYYAITGPFTEAKQCALIAVDEIMKVCNLMDGGFSFGYEIQFWNEVKNEIELL